MLSIWSRTINTKGLRMLTLQDLKDLLHLPGLSRREQLLLILAHSPDTPMPTYQIKELAIQSGLREANKWNISDILRKSRPYVILTEVGWELTTPGLDHVNGVAAPLIGSPKPKVAVILRQHLSAIKDPAIKSFVEEAIACMELRLYRSAVVLSWIGAASILQKHIVDNRLQDFNQEAFRRNSKWRNAKNSDGIGRMKESEFLDILEALSIIGKNVKQELKNCLTLRNGCGHPSSLRIGESRTSSHIEVLVLNVFSQFSA